MADSLTLPRQQTKNTTPEIKVQTYWGAVGAKLLHDKITLAAMLLGLFMVIITLAAPWIGDNILGFDPTDTNLRSRKAAPTWFEEAWDQFQGFSRTCQGSNGCAPSMGPMV